MTPKKTLISCMKFTPLMIRVNKVLKLKVFENTEGKPWTCSVVDASLEILSGTLTFRCFESFPIYSLRQSVEGE